MTNFEDKRDEVLRLQNKLDSAVKKANHDLDSRGGIKIPTFLELGGKRMIDNRVYYQMAEETEMYRKVSLVKDALIKTNQPKYFKLGRFLEKILEYTPHFVNDDYEKAMHLVEDMTPTGELKEFNTKKEIKTVYKEFQKIDNRRRGMTKKRVKLIIKYKDVERFIHHNLDTIADYLEGFDPNANYYGKDDRFTPEGLTEYFDGMRELEFLGTSELTKGIRK